MRQSDKLTGAIWLLQLVISSPLIHALGDPSQSLTQIWTQVPSMRGVQLTNWAMPPPNWLLMHDATYRILMPNIWQLFYRTWCSWNTHSLGLWYHQVWQPKPCNTWLPLMWTLPRRPGSKVKCYLANQAHPRSKHTMFSFWMTLIQLLLVAKQVLNTIFGNDPREFHLKKIIPIPQRC